ncbi:hypothetical protein WR25_24571, partial [Diploscapter pachys]
VSLVHASDSVRSVPLGLTPPTSTSTFASSFPSASSAQNRMNKPPVRVVAHAPGSRIAPSPSTYRQPSLPPYGIPFSASFPQQSHGLNCHASIPTMSVQPMAGRTYDEVPDFVDRRKPVYSTNLPYNELVDLAENHRKQMNANRNEESFRQQMLVAGDVTKKLRDMKIDVAKEEGELRRLSELEHETRALRQRNEERDKELKEGAERLEEERRIMQIAANRVKTLTQKWEEQRKRRQNAAAIALQEQRKMQLQSSCRSSEPSATSSRSALNDVSRPRASVGPFQVQHNQQYEDHQYNIKDQADRSDSKSDSNANIVQRMTVGDSPLRDHENKDKSKEQKKPNDNIEYRIERPTWLGDGLDEAKLREGRTDLVSIRSDSLKATKRRSWAASEGTSMSEAEVIQRMYLDAQKRGSHHFVPELAVSPPESQEYQRKLPEPEKLDEQQPETSSEKTITDEESSMKSDEEPVEMDIPNTQKKVQGILKCRKGNDDKSDKENKNRHIRFDPLALLLDAALEGEIDLVKTSASQLGNVSIANDEGITALHNAICAGHYEIVRFLIEQNADVNAPDSDGWTPLHCAASCNNLPMVRQLVEGGACVLSSTLSDMETPVEKCEEEEEGYDGCLRYLTAAYHATGTINDGKVYTAYDYEAQYEDELDMNDGDEIKVLSKETEDQHWWFCERIKDGKKGLAPRTYLALYPALRFRKDLNFVMFDIISQSANSNLESNSPNSGQASVASSN